MALTGARFALTYDPSQGRTDTVAGKAKALKDSGPLRAAEAHWVAEVLPGVVDKSSAAHVTIDTQKQLKTHLKHT